VSRDARASILNSSAAPVSRLEQKLVYLHVLDLPREKSGNLGMCGSSVDISPLTKYSMFERERLIQVSPHLDHKFSRC